MTDFKPNNSHDLSGQVALVTGATSGLGWHFSRVLAAAGATVAIAGRRENNLQQLASLIAQDGGQCLPCVLDVTDEEQIVSTVERIDEDLGTLSVLVNNAGIADAQWATRIPIALIDQVIGTNLRGPFIMAREVAARLIKAGKPGRIVNISSMMAYDYQGIGAALYSITKAGVARMTEALAVEWARYHINVNAIAPGAFESEMIDGMQERIGDIAAGFVRKRLGHPSQLDSTLLYLCSPASECVTGTIVKVDDGQSPR